MRCSPPVGARSLGLWICGLDARRGAAHTANCANMDPCVLPVPLLVLLLLQLLAHRPCSGFNIDERFPVIKEGKTRGSLFGLSVALHHQTEGSRKNL